MNNEDITNRMIRDFLLGGLDEAATERLDELSIMDAGFADRLAVERYELIDEWIAGRLNAADRKRFEAVLARSPTMRERVEVGGMLAATAPKAVVGERPRQPSFFAGLFSGWPRLAYGVAGFALLVGVVGLAVIFLRRDAGQEIAVVDPPVVSSPTANITTVPTPAETPAGLESPSPSPRLSPTPTPTRPVQATFATLVLTPPMRGSTAVRSVKLESGVEFLHLTLQTEATASGRFAVEIGDDAGGTDWRSAVVRGRSANGRTSVFVRVPASKLKNGVRSVRLIDVGSGSEVLDEHAIKIEW